MKTYRYMFVYIAIIPAIFFIFWWLIFNIWYFYDLQFNYKIIGTFLMAVWFLYFIINMIYKWIKSTFAIYSAIDKDDYSKNNFLESIIITNKKWWRIIWNLILVWLIVWLLSSVASNIFSIFFGKIWDFSLIDFENINFEMIKNFASTFSFFNYFASWFLNNLVNTIGTVFIYIFIYVFYKRLVFEYTNNSEITVSKDEKKSKKETSENIEL